MTHTTSLWSAYDFVFSSFFLFDSKNWVFHKKNPFNKVCEVHALNVKCHALNYNCKSTHMDGILTEN